jgi:hypothetical protein
VNSVLRHLANMSAGLAAYLVSQGQAAIDDGNPTVTLTNALAAAIAHQILSYAYAPKASPALTGIPTTPTAANGTNNSQIANTAFVQTVAQAVQSWASSLFASQADLHGNYSTTSAIENWVETYFLQTSAAWATFQPLLGFTPVTQTGTNRVQLGWSGTKLQAQVDATPLGPFAFYSDFKPTFNAYGGYLQFGGAGNLVIQWGTVTIGGGGDLINLPTSFPTAALVLITNDNHTGNGPLRVTSGHFAAGNAFNAYGFDPPTGQPVQTALQWAAIGY